MLGFGGPPALPFEFELEGLPAPPDEDELREVICGRVGGKTPPKSDRSKMTHTTEK